ncbi:MAG: hypothetical protein KGH65_04250 [Candidatus Micrarchaeota archaeon]|nr:hypothetical protein [Candidatus Micrarchaeota archaeon]
MVVLSQANEKPPIIERPAILKDSQRMGGKAANMENIALRNVVQESWRTKVKHDKNLMDLIDDHASNMHRLLGNAEYEIFCIHNLISNTKNMSKAEVRGYIRIIEGLAYFYNIKLGADLASTLLTGLTFKAKNLDSIGRYYKMMIMQIDSRIKKFESKASLENKRMEGLALELKYNESSIITRIFRKNRLNSLRSKMNSKRKRLDAINTRISKNKKVLESINKTIKGSS